MGWRRENIYFRIREIHGGMFKSWLPPCGPCTFGWELKSSISLSVKWGYGHLLFRADIKIN